MQERLLDICKSDEDGVLENQNIIDTKLKKRPAQDGNTELALIKEFEGYTRAILRYTSVQSGSSEYLQR